ncbi:MAG TPA: hypothetical protein VK921_13270 [Anditalea sp.]|nr:hypothetical protein [Anditalea sp.]
MTQISIQTTTPSIAKSTQFYETLGFQKIPSEGRSIFTDGMAIIEINTDRFARSGFRLYKKSWSEEISFLQQNSIIEYSEGYMTTDPNGVWIYLIESEFMGEVSERKNFSKLGNYSGISIETISMVRSLDFYQVLGFSVAAGSTDSPWMTLSHPSGFGISFMKPQSCPHLFFNPSLTYFNGTSNPSVIQSIRNEDIPITEEITYFNKDGEVDNIIIRDPGGLGFFIFND